MKSQKMPKNLSSLDEYTWNVDKQEKCYILSLDDGIDKLPIAFFTRDALEVEGNDCSQLLLNTVKDCYKKILGENGILVDENNFSC